jgi:hypothetical protein
MFKEILLTLVEPLFNVVFNLAESQLFTWMRPSFDLLKPLIVKPNALVNKFRVVSHKNLKNVVLKFGTPMTKEDVEFEDDIDLISNMLATTLFGAIDKFSHSY